MDLRPDLSESFLSVCSPRLSREVGTDLAQLSPGEDLSTAASWSLHIPHTCWCPGFWGEGPNYSTNVGRVLAKVQARQCKGALSYSP